MYCSLERNFKIIITLRLREALKKRTQKLHLQIFACSAKLGLSLYCLPVRLAIDAIAVAHRKQLLSSDDSELARGYEKNLQFQNDLNMNWARLKVARKQKKGEDEQEG